MSYRDLRAHPKDSAAFYANALKYGQYLWLHGHAGRSILAITRALYAPLPSNDPVYSQHPLPYAALGWIVAKNESDDFPGNPRISFQHQATRLRGDREPIRRARAWGVWTIICKVRPQLESDLKDPIVPPPHANHPTTRSIRY